MSLLEELNDSQRAAVEYCEGPQLVIAGAGSGKTRVLTYKIAYLLEHGMLPWTILALTFTNKAASEMKERISRLVGSDRASRLQMGTFHSVFSRILRMESEAIGYKSNYTIYDETDSRSLIKAIVKEMGLDDKVYKPATVHSRISMAKNHLITAEQYALDGSAISRDRDARLEQVYKVYLAYQQRLQKADAMDFDDLLVLTWRLFNEHDDIRRKYAERFQYVLVDEYQDTNFAQQSIVRQLTEERQMVCVVGDDYQSIYGFRGANIDNILDFKKIYPAARLFKLERNYRSTQSIVGAANSLMKHNRRQIPKNVYSENAEGDQVVLKPVYSDREEAAVVCREIKRIRRQDSCDYNDFAILYRTNSQSRPFEEEMRRMSIPYRIFGGLSFYQRKEIKDIIAYFRLVVNPDDEEAFKRVINYPARGIGQTTVSKVVACAQRNGVSLWEVIGHAAECGLDVNKGTLSKLNAFQTLINGFAEESTVKDAYQLGREIIKSSGISADLYSGTDADSVARQENLEEFMGGLSDFVETQQEEDRADHVFLADFLQEVALLTDLDSDDNAQSRVVLMTIHAAKGLEFPTVFIVGLEENIFPSPMSADTPRGLEEERRLLYVAITRAERHCVMTCAKSRWRFGRMEMDEPSRFLRDIDPRFLKIDRETVAAGGLSRKPMGRASWGTDVDYEPNRPYAGCRDWGKDSHYSSRMQNSRPVADRFMADPQPKVTRPRRPEQAVDPLGEGTKRRLMLEGGNMRRLSSVISNGGRSLQGTGSGDGSALGLREGSVIEHQRFGIGTVVKIEGTGENMKATVDFKNTGRKQLLLKFARYNVVK